MAKRKHRSARQKRPGVVAVLTGDVVGSSSLAQGEPHALRTALAEAFRSVVGMSPNLMWGQFDVHRGDSFQGVLARPELALRSAVLLRASMRSTREPGARRPAIDARIAVGIGPVDYLPPPSEGPSHGLGEAFIRSGTLLDHMESGEARLRFRTSWPDLDEQLNPACALLDALISHWSGHQSQVVHTMLCRFADDEKPLTQQQAAKRLGIGQSTVSQQLQAVGFNAVREFLRAYEAAAARRLSGREA